MDVSEYRKQYTEELEQAAKNQPSYRDFLNKSERASRRPMPLQFAGGGGEQDEVTEIAGIIRDKDEDTQRRTTALHTISNEISSRPALLDMALGLLADTAEPAALRLAALRVLQVSSFRAAVFAPKRPEYLAVLRTCIDDENIELRGLALEILAREKDEYVQRRLLEGLAHPSKALVRPQQAIQLLGYDIHAEHYPILRQIVKQPPNRAAQKEAVRLLAADTGSKNLLAEVVQDKSESREIRRLSAIALQSLAPKEFAEQAKQIVLDDDEDDTLRAAVVDALAHLDNPAEVREDSTFTERVQQLREKATSKSLKQATARYMSKQGR